MIMCHWRLEYWLLKFSDLCFCNLRWVILFCERQAVFDWAGYTHSLVVLGAVCCCAVSLHHFEKHSRIITANAQVVLAGFLYRRVKVLLTVSLSQSVCFVQTKNSLQKKIFYKLFVMSHWKYIHFFIYWKDYLLYSMVHVPSIPPPPPQSSYTFKTLPFSHSSRQQSNTTQGTDVLREVENVTELVVTLACLWSTPLRVALCLGLLWVELGPGVLVGVALLLVLIPVNSAVERKAKQLQVSKARLLNNSLGVCMCKIRDEACSVYFCKCSDADMFYNLCLLFLRELSWSSGKGVNNSSRKCCINTRSFLFLILTRDPDIYSPNNSLEFF